MDTLFKTISKILGLVIFFTIFVLFPIAIGICILGALIVPITWLYGFFTDQSYARICDNSEMLYRLNQIGKYAIVMSAALGLFFLVIKVII